MSTQLSNQSERIEAALERIRESFEECPEILGPVARLFRGAYVPDMHALRVALENGDNARFAFLAHKIKGSASYFRVDYVTDLAAELELRGKCGSLAGVSDLVDQLGDGLDSVSAALRDEEERLAARRSTDKP
ncbi:MAG: Hpt domain-containing protein [Candidatus Korobacteraceae bacterium]